MLVVAAVIERDGRILIGQRRRQDRHSLKWEFPGGKVEPGETPREALIRELREELDIAVSEAEELRRYAYRYADRPNFELIFYRVTEFEGEPRNLAFEKIEWTPPRALLDYDFLAGDAELVRFLARGR
jgi:8-oxo-dGTP diphosphatase